MYNYETTLYFKNWAFQNNDFININIQMILSKYGDVELIGYYSESSLKSNRGPQVLYKQFNEISNDKSIIRLDDLYYIFKFSDTDYKFHAKYEIDGNNIDFRFSIASINQEEGQITDGKIEIVDFIQVKTIMDKFILEYSLPPKSLSL